jgi:uncharacterized membrane protein
MDYLLIIVLGIVVVSLWNSNRDAHERLREAVDRLEREIEFFRSQLAALIKANAHPAEAKVATPVNEVASPKPAATPPATQAVHNVPHPVQAFTPPTEPKPAPATPPAPVPAPPLQASTPPVAQPAQPVSPIKHPIPAAAAFQAAPAQAGSQEPSARARLFSLEETLGANWLNKIGIASLVIGLAFFLAWKLQTWGPGGKVLCGFAVSIAMLGGGVWLERKPTYRIFARGGIGGGWALAYFTTFAMYHLQAARILHSLPFGLVLMLLVAAGMVGHSLRYRSQTVTSLAFMLGFATLLTSHIEEPNQTVAFSLAASAILAIALVVVTTIRHWAMLELCGLIAVYVSHFVWLNEVLPSNHATFAEFWPSTALILLYWLIFRLAYVLRTPLEKREEDLSSISAIVNSAGVLGLLKFQAAHPEWAFWALVVLGILEMALAWWAKSKRRQAFAVLSTIAVVLFVSSVPFRFHGVSWPVLWLVQAQVLAIAGLRLGEPVFRRLGLLVGVITGGVLALHDVMPLAFERLVSSDPNRHWSLAIGLALSAILYWTHAEVYPRRWPEIKANALEIFALKISSWLALGAAATCLWVVLPNQWLPIGWIALFLLLVSAGHLFGTVNTLLEGDAVALGAAGLLAFNHVLPLAFFRLGHADPGSHAAETTVLTLAALAYWLRAEIFPRVLPTLDPPDSPPSLIPAWLGFIVPCMSWLGLGAAATAMWVGMPDQWLPLGWIALFIVLVIAGQRFRAPMPPLEGDVLALASAGVLVFHHVFPLLFFRFENSDPGWHPALTTVLSLAALAFWIRAELLPRTLPALPNLPNWNPATWEAVFLPLASCIGTASAAAALWVVLPVQWVAVGWLALVLVLGLAADGISSKVLALQADLLALTSWFTLVAVWDEHFGEWRYRLPMLAAIALFYCGMHRKTVPGSRNYVPSTYSWAAAPLLFLITRDIFAYPWTAPVLIALCLILFEVGRFARKGFLRWQGYVLFAVAFLLYLGRDLPNAASASTLRSFTPVGSGLLEVLILIVAGYWLLERTRDSNRNSTAEHIVGLVEDLSGGEGWVVVLWSAIATVLMALAWLMRRRTFLVQAIALALAVVVRALLFDLGGSSGADFWHGPLYRISVAALVLIAALPFAFKLRGPEFWKASSIPLPEPIAPALSHPEQWFFFAPFALMVASLAIKLSSGHITIAWSLLGLGAFLFALAVGERSFRLAGLILLLVSVAKILLMDVWKLSTPDKFTTLIILGLALIAVSFLYTRFSEAIRKYL